MRILKLTVHILQMPVAVIDGMPEGLELAGYATSNKFRHDGKKYHPKSGQNLEIVRGGGAIYALGRKRLAIGASNADGLQSASRKVLEYLSVEGGFTVRRLDTNDVGQAFLPEAASA